MAKGKVSVSSNAVKAKCNAIASELSEMKKYLDAISTQVSEMQSKKIWVGGTRSVKRYKDLNDTVTNSNKVISSIANLNDQVMNAASKISKSA